MYEDALSFSLFGQEVFLYGLFVSLGALAAILLFAALCRRQKLPGGTAALFGALALPLGLICSRLLFCLLDFRFHGLFSPRAALSFWGGGFSMVGALLGAALAGALTAKKQRLSALALLDVLSPALLLFIAFARLGEPYTEVLGRSRPLVIDWVKNSFLAISDGYDAYLRTYALEALTALILCIILLIYLRRRPRRGNVLFTGMLLLGCTQVLWESLRFDAHMRQSFISMQQILFACMFAVPLIRSALRCKRKGYLIAAIAVCALVAGGAVGIEFMIDRSGVSRLLLYAVYALLLALPAALGLYFQKRSDRA